MTTCIIAIIGLVICEKINDSRIRALNERLEKLEKGSSHE
jgi:hypothetical protein